MQGPYRASNWNSKERARVDLSTTACENYKINIAIKERLIQHCMECYIKMGRVENCILQVENEFKEAQQTLYEIGSTLFDEAQNALLHISNPPLKEASKSSNYECVHVALDEDIPTSTDKK